MRIHALLGDDPRIIALDPTSTVLEATQEMVRQDCGSMLVIDSSGALLGIFTERDLMSRIVGPGLDPASIVLGDVMTTELYTTDPEREVTQVRRDMRKRHIRHVPVMMGEKILGVLSNRDLLRARFEEVRGEAEAMTDYIRGSN